MFLTVIDVIVLFLILDDKLSGGLSLTPPNARHCSLAVLDTQ